MTAAAVNAYLLENKALNKSMYTSSGSIGCWMSADSRFVIKGQNKYGKNIWGLEDEIE